MIVLAYSLALSATALGLHILLWRISLPKRQTRALLLIFLAVLVVGLGGAMMGLLPRLTLIEELHVAIFQVAAALAYACLYSAIEGDSPSVAIVRFTAAAGEQGRRRDAYKAIVNDDLLIGSRFRAMIRDGLVEERPDGYRLTAAGERLAAFFTATSRFFAMSGSG